MLGVVLAGGRGTRMGGAKPAAALAGRPLIEWPLAALAEACERSVVVCKRATELPRLPAAVERWDEPDEPLHPLTGLGYALERAAGTVAVVAADMPFVTGEVIAEVGAARGGAQAAVGVGEGGVVQPLLAVYGIEALAPLRAAGSSGRLTDAVLALDPVRVDLPPGVARSVDTPAALKAAEAELA